MIGPKQLGLDADLVAGRLYQGSYPPEDGRVARFAQAIVFAADELQPSKYKFRGVTKIYAPNFDDGQRMSSRRWSYAVSAAQDVRRLVDMGKTVLVTCHAGLNRSGLISALVLMMPPSQAARDGSTPSCLTSREAVMLVKAARGPRALSNMQFIAALDRLSGRLCPGPRPVFSPRARSIR